MLALFNIFETFFVEELSIVAVTLTRQGEIGVGWVQVDPSTVWPDHLNKNVHKYVQNVYKNMHIFNGDG